MPGFCNSATLEEVGRHGHVLTTGRHTGIAPQLEDLEPFEEIMGRLTPQWRVQQAEADKLDVAIDENLTLLGFGSESEGER